MNADTLALNIQSLNIVLWSYISEILAHLNNSDFFIATSGSAFGAFGGAYCLWLINKKSEHEKALSLINTTLANLIAHLNSLLNLKQQHVLPICAEMDSIQEKIKNPKLYIKDNTLEITGILLFVHILETKYDTSGIVENLSPFAYKDSTSLLLAIKVKEALLSVENITRARNDIIKIIKDDPRPSEEKILFYFGLTKANDITDSSFTDCTRGLLYNIDVALHFIDLLIPRIQKNAKLILQKKYGKKIMTFELFEPYKELIPPKDFIDGWVE